MNKARQFLLFLITLVGVAGAGCGMLGVQITGSGTTVTQNYDLPTFSRVEVAGAFDVEITPAEKQSVAITIDDNLVEYLDVSQSDETLRIRMKPNLRLRSATLKAAVALPELTAITLSGATDGRVKGLRSDKPLRIDVSGASTLKGEIKSGDAEIEISGASTVELRGGAGSLEVTVSGASTADLEEYASTDTHVHVSGASHAVVNPSAKLDAEASGASSVLYVGMPSSVKSDASGASSVRKK